MYNRTSREAVDKPRQLMQALAARIDRSSSSQSFLWTSQFPIFFLDLRGLLRHRSSFHGRRRIDYTEHPFLRDEADFAHGVTSPTLRPDEFLERFSQKPRTGCAHGCCKMISRCCHEEKTPETNIITQPQVVSCFKSIT